MYKPLVLYNLGVTGYGSLAPASTKAFDVKHKQTPEKGDSILPGFSL